MLNMIEGEEEEEETIYTTEREQTKINDDSKD
jgi:hypothetical protein